MHPEVMELSPPKSSQIPWNKLSSLNSSWSLPAKTYHCLHSVVQGPQWENHFKSSSQK